MFPDTILVALQNILTSYAIEISNSNNLNITYKTIDAVILKQD